MLHIITGLFNTFTFWRLGNSYIDMQSRLFSVFMTFIIAPPLVQQLQPRYLHFRDLYQSREANSKIYSWIAFVISTILPELPYSIVAGSIYFNTWLVSHPSPSYKYSIKHQVLGHRLPTRLLPLRLYLDDAHALRSILRRLRAIHRSARSKRELRFPPRPRVLHLRRLLLRRSSPLRIPPALLAILDVLAHPVPVPP